MKKEAEDKITTIVISEKAPLSSTLTFLTGKSYNHTDFEGMAGKGELLTEVSTGRKFTVLNGKEAKELGVDGLQIPSEHAIKDFYDAVEEDGEATTTHRYLNKGLFTAQTISSILQGYATGQTPKEKHELFMKLHGAKNNYKHRYNEGGETKEHYTVNDIVHHGNWIETKDKLYKSYEGSGGYSYWENTELTPDDKKVYPHRGYGYMFVSNSIKDQDSNYVKLLNELLSETDYRGYAKGGGVGDYHNVPYWTYKGFNASNKNFSTLEEAQDELKKLRQESYYKNVPETLIIVNVPADNRMQIPKQYQVIQFDKDYKFDKQGMILSYAEGGDINDDLGVKFIPYKETEIMFSPKNKYQEKDLYFSNDEEFYSLEDAQKYIDDGSKPSQKTINAYRHGAFADGGGVGDKYLFTFKQNTNLHNVEKHLKENGIDAEYSNNGVTVIGFDNSSKAVTILNKSEFKYSNIQKHETGGGVGMKNLDKIKLNIGDVIYNHISGLTEDQLKSQLSGLQIEIKLELDKNGKSQRFYKLKDEEFFILYRLGKGNEFQYATGGVVKSKTLKKYSFAKGGGVVDEKFVSKIRSEVNDFLNPLGYSARVEELAGGVIHIEPSTRLVGEHRKDFFDGMQISRWVDGTYEVSEYQAGKNENELHIFKETKSLIVALKDLIKGNKRKPIKKYSKGGGVENRNNNFQEIDGNKYFSYDFDNKGNKWTVSMVWGKYNHVNVTKKTNNPFGSKLGTEFKTLGEAVDNYKDVNIKSNILFAGSEAKKRGYEPKYANGGGVDKIKVTKISEIPHIKKKVDDGQVTYRGLGMGKLSNDFYKITGENGQRIKVDGKEYFITDTDFRKLDWDFENEKWLNKIRFSAPFRKFATGGGVGEKRYLVFLSTEATGENYDEPNYETNSYASAINWAKKKSTESHPSKPKGFEYSDYNYVANVFDTVSSKIVADFADGELNYVDEIEKTYHKKYYMNPKHPFSDKEVGLYFTKETGATDNLIKIVEVHYPNANMEVVKSFMGNLSEDGSYEKHLEEYRAWNNGAGKDEKAPTKMALRESIKLFHLKPVEEVEIKGLNYGRGGNITTLTKNKKESEAKMEAIVKELGGHSKPYISGMPLTWIYKADNDERKRVPEKYHAELDKLSEDIHRWEAYMSGEKYAKGGGVNEKNITVYQFFGGFLQNGSIYPPYPRLDDNWHKDLSVVEKIYKNASEKDFDLTEVKDMDGILFFEINKAQVPEIVFNRTKDSSDILEAVNYDIDHIKERAIYIDGTPVSKDELDEELGAYRNGGGVDDDAYYKVINHFVYFTFNYPNNFMDAFGHKDNHIRKHIEEKFDSYYKKYGSYGVMIKFWIELDGDNRNKLADWIKENYKGKPLDYSGNTSGIINHFVYFTLNYPNNFMDAFGDKDDYIRKHIETKFNTAYEKYGAYGAMTKFWTDLDAENKEKFANWIKENYTGQSLTYKTGGGVGNLFEKGNLVFAKDEGSRGLVGLIVSESPKKYSDFYEVEVLFRGYNGDVLDYDTNFLEPLEEGHLDFAENNGDISAYKNIAKKLGITLNPIYEQMIEESENENYKTGGKVEKGTPEWHQLQIAKRTINMNPAMASVMGGMSIDEAKAILDKHNIKYADGGGVDKYNVTTSRLAFDVLNEVMRKNILSDSEINALSKKARHGTSEEVAEARVELIKLMSKLHPSTKDKLEKKFTFSEGGGVEEKQIFTYTDKNIEGRHATKLIRATGENGLGKYVERLSDKEVKITVPSDEKESEELLDIVEFCVGRNNLVPFYSDGGGVDFPTSNQTESNAKSWLNQLIKDRGRKEAERIVRYNLTGKNEYYRYDNIYDTWLASAINNEKFKSGGSIGNMHIYVQEISGKTGLRENAIINYILENNLSEEDVLKIVSGLGRKQLLPMDVMTAISGNKDNAYSKKIINFTKSNTAFKMEQGGALSPSELEGFEKIFKKYADKDYFGTNDLIEMKEKERIKFAEKGNETAIKTTKQDIIDMFHALDHRNALDSFNKLKLWIDTGNKEEIKKRLRASQKFTIELVELLSHRSLKDKTNQKQLDEFVDSLPVKKMANGGGVQEVIATIRYNDYWKKYQVTVEGTIYGEFDNIEEAKEFIHHGGWKLLIKTDKKIKLNSGADIILNWISDEGYSYNLLSDGESHAHLFALKGTATANDIASKIVNEKFDTGGEVKEKKDFHKCGKGTKIQTLIFDNAMFDRTNAKKWAKDNNFVHNKSDVTENKIRLRQVSPTLFKRKSFRTIELTDGVQAVIGCPKK